jgi:hypothetical protein
LYVRHPKGQPRAVIVDENLVTLPKTADGLGRNVIQPRLVCGRRGESGDEGGVREVADGEYRPTVARPRGDGRKSSTGQARARQLQVLLELPYGKIEIL